MNISVDVGDVLVDRKKNRVVQGIQVHPVFSNAQAILKWMLENNHQLFIISKVDEGTEELSLKKLELCRLVPNIIETENVHFCYEREQKAEIARNLGIHAHVDDRAQVMNALSKVGVPHKILFLEGHDDRAEFSLETDVLEARNWLEVQSIVKHLPHH